MLKAFWAFSRPHTIYGTSVSVLGLFILAQPDWHTWAGLGTRVLLTLLACLAMNVYIVGLNQIIDIDIDRINKPQLPLAAGSLSVPQAVIIVACMACLAVGVAFSQGLFLMLTVVVSGLIGTAYSLPPLRLKRFPFLAGLCIYGVRGLVVNLGLYSHFRGVELTGFPLQLLVLTGWITLFALVIALVKDIPDMEGDRRFAIATFSLKLGQRPVLDGSTTVLSLGYLLLALFGGRIPGVNAWLLGLGHCLALGILWWGRWGTDPGSQSQVTRFYQLIWKLFYVEYILFPLSFVFG